MELLLINLLQIDGNMWVAGGRCAAGMAPQECSTPISVAQVLILDQA